jgi:hypothetical protein
LLIIVASSIARGKGVRRLGRFSAEKCVQAIARVAGALQFAHLCFGMVAAPISRRHPAATRQMVYEPSFASPPPVLLEIFSFRCSLWVFPGLFISHTLFVEKEERTGFLFFARCITLQFLTYCA